jgi:hypothetical protein
MRAFIATGAALAEDTATTQLAILGAVATGNLSLFKVVCA